MRVFRSSAVTGEGVDALLEAAWREIVAVRAIPAEEDREVEDAVNLIEQVAVRKAARAGAQPASPTRGSAQAEPASPKRGSAKAGGKA